MTIKAYSYVRFSSFRQAGGDSTRRQTELAENYAIKHGLDLQDLRLKDLGVSAFSGDNSSTGALGTFIDMVESGEIEKGSYLLVENLDRLSRENVPVALTKFLSLIGLGIVVVTLSDEQVYQQDKMDTYQLIITITIMARANDESAVKSMRTKAVWRKRKEEARENGEFITNSNYPRWLKREENQLSVIPEHALTINQVFQWSIEGYGYQKIAEMLNTQGVHTFHTGRPWVGTNVYNLLRNHAVIGEYQPYTKVNGERELDGGPIKNYYPVIVEPAVFLEAQQAIDNRKQRGGGYRKNTFRNLFTGLIQCECGKAVTIGSQNKSGGSYLKCSGGCKGRVRYQYIEPQILTALSQLKRVTDKYSKPASNELATVKLEICQLESRLIDLAALLAELPSRATARAAQETEERLDELKVKEVRLVGEQAVTETRSAIVLGNEDLNTAKERGSFNAKLRAVLDYIWLSEERDRLVYFSDSQPVLEQRIYKSHMKLSTDIIEMDGTVIGHTCREKPLELILDERLELPDFELCLEELTDEEGNQLVNVTESEIVDGITRTTVTRNYSVEEV